MDLGASDLERVDVEIKGIAILGEGGGRGRSCLVRPDRVSISSRGADVRSKEVRVKRWIEERFVLRVVSHEDQQR